MASSGTCHTSKIFLMKVKLVKDHDIYGKAGDTVEVHEGRAKYLHSVGVIKLSEKTAAKVDEATEETLAEKEEKATKKTKEEKTSKETK
jgi:ribosomal protein L9